MQLGWKLLAKRCSILLRELPFRTAPNRCGVMYASRVHTRAHTPAAYTLPVLLGKKGLWVMGQRRQIWGTSWLRADGEDRRQDAGEVVRVRGMRELGKDFFSPGADMDANERMALAKMAGVSLDDCARLLHVVASRGERPDADFFAFMLEVAISEFINPKIKKDASIPAEHNMNKIQTVLGYMQSQGLGPNRGFLETAMNAMLQKSDLQGAIQMMRMEQQLIAPKNLDAGTHEKLIMVADEHGDAVSALVLIEDMIVMGFLPNMKAKEAALSACFKQRNFSLKNNDNNKQFIRVAVNTIIRACKEAAIKLPSVQIAALDACMWLITRHIRPALLQHIEIKKQMPEDEDTPEFVYKRSCSTIIELCVLVGDLDRALKFYEEFVPAFSGRVAPRIPEAKEFLYKAEKASDAPPFGINVYAACLMQACRSGERTWAKELHAKIMKGEEAFLPQIGDGEERDKDGGGIEEIMDVGWGKMDFVVEDALEAFEKMMSQPVLSRRMPLA